MNVHRTGSPTLALALLLLLNLRLAGAVDTIHTGQLLPANEAARTMRVPDGFQVTLFAGEPAVQQPIGFCLDDRGRLWVAEAYNYPHHGTRPGDRIVILEDTDGDGQFDVRKVFYDQLNYVTGIEVGFGGAWVMSPPSFYFIPDRDGDDRPDGPPQVLLDGFGNHANSHNLANGFAWGPDGWLYGTHGRTNWSLLGRPGTPAEQRVRFDGGVYRYHPVRHEWEPYADGTTNPWGIDWNDVGEAFVCNCVNPHLFHVIQGAHYEPWRNRKSSEFAYERIPTIADHLHFVGTVNVRDGLGSVAEDAAGGGHAHCGTMVYLGDNWPESYRNSLFTNNIHGRRINNDLLHRHGSGYRASHGADLMASRDPWFMGVTLAYGPGGEVYVSDWSDTGECHSVTNTQRQTGRIYRIAYGDLRRPQVDLERLTDNQLVELQLHANDWYVRHARRLLQERAAAGHDMSQVHDRLRQMFVRQTDIPRKLRALWALYVTQGTDSRLLIELLGHDSEYLRAWGVRLLCEERDPPAEALRQFERLAAQGDSQLVRLHLASVLQRLDAARRWPIAAALASRSEDNDDASLPLMLWYGIEPLVHDDPDRLVQLAGQSRISFVRQAIARRVMEQRDSAPGLERLVRQLAQTDDADVQADLLRGTLRGLEGRHTVAAPSQWTTAYARLSQSPRREVREQALLLALVFDDPVALASLRQQAVDGTLPTEQRSRAIDALVGRRPADLATLLLELVDDAGVRLAAVRGLAHYHHAETVSVLLSGYAEMDSAARQQTLQTLAARPDWAARLLDAVESQQVSARDLTAYTVRQIQSLQDAELTRRLRDVWGEIRTTPDDRRRQIERYRRQLTAEVLAHADVVAGRAVFEKQCANCHRFFDLGGSIGPDITGSQRSNLDYLLENILDPSAAVARDFRMQVLELNDGRVLTGLVEGETERAVTLLTIDQRLVVPVSEIDERHESDVSMMPDGLLNPLTIDEVRDLIGFLQSSPGAPTDHDR
jgi:putative membrane-bound dehydrogenase-like protein